MSIANRALPTVLCLWFMPTSGLPRGAGRRAGPGEFSAGSAWRWSSRVFVVLAHSMWLNLAHTKGMKPLRPAEGGIPGQLAPNMTLQLSRYGSQFSEGARCGERCEPDPASAGTWPAAAQAAHRAGHDGRRGRGQTAVLAREGQPDGDGGAPSVSARRA